MDVLSKLTVKRDPVDPIEVLRKKDLDAFAPIPDALTVSDIVDSLTSTDIDKPLSANQGRILAGMVGGGAGPGNMPHFWIEPSTGHLWYEGVAGMFQINAAGHLEYIFTTS